VSRCVVRRPSTITVGRSCSKVVVEARPPPGAPSGRMSFGKFNPTVEAEAAKRNGVKEEVPGSSAGVSVSDGDMATTLKRKDTELTQPKTKKPKTCKKLKPSAEADRGVALGCKES
jgi:hypothetical protein